MTFTAHVLLIVILLLGANVAHSQGVHESDDDSRGANRLSSSLPQTHTLHSGNDTDWFFFTGNPATQNAFNVTIEKPPDLHLQLEAFSSPHAISAENPIPFSTVSGCHGEEVIDTGQLGASSVPTFFRLSACEGAANAADSYEVSVHVDGRLVIGIVTFTRGYARDHLGRPVDSLWVRACQFGCGGLLDRTRADGRYTVNGAVEYRFELISNDYEIDPAFEPVYIRDSVAIRVDLRVQPVGLVFGSSFETMNEPE